MVNSWFLIANPTAGNGKFSELWKEIQYLLKTYKIEVEFAFTKYSKHEVELVQDAIQKGYRNIISAGGDGTLHHVVNGIMTQIYTKTSNITVAVLPIGTGNDWIKTYNIPKDIKKSVALIHLKKTILQDIGYLELKNKTAYFNNVAGLGYDGYVVNKLNKLKRFGAIAYLISGIAGLLFYKKTTFKIKFNDKEIKTKCLMTLFGICKYSAGGMQLTAYKSSSDGMFDITIAKNLALADFIINMPKLYNGKIIHHKKVETYKTNSIIVTPINKNDTPFIQADGELIGKGKLKVSVIKNAIKFIIN